MHVYFFFISDPLELEQYPKFLELKFFFHSIKKAFLRILQLKGGPLVYLIHTRRTNFPCSL